MAFRPAGVTDPVARGPGRDRKLDVTERGTIDPGSLLMSARQSWPSAIRRRDTGPAPGSQSNSPASFHVAEPGDVEDALLLQPPLDPRQQDAGEQYLVASWENGPGLRRACQGILEPRPRVRGCPALPCFMAARRCALMTAISHDLRTQPRSLQRYAARLRRSVIQFSDSAGNTFAPRSVLGG
jgi:hypothetical protein